MLALDTGRAGIGLVVLRGVDIPTCMEQGGAALGVVGGDVLREQEHAGLHDPFALGIGQCRMMLAAPEQYAAPRASYDGARIATKYPNVTRAFFAGRGDQVQVIPLYGSMELAPLLGIADYIVDLVDTGATLRAHGLKPVCKLMDIAARLVVNKAALRMEYDRIHPLVEAIGKAAAAAAPAA